MEPDQTDVALKQIESKTIVGAKVDWGDDRCCDSVPHEIRLEFSDGSHMTIMSMGWDSSLVAYYYGKI